MRLKIYWVGVPLAAQNFLRNQAASSAGITYKTPGVLNIANAGRYQFGSLIALSITGKLAFFKKNYNQIHN